MENKQVKDWLEISGLMLRGLLPPGAGDEPFGHDLPPETFAVLVDRESARVDHALVALATAPDETAVRALFAQLHPDTVMALFSRWAHYTKAWQGLLHQPHPPLWFPPRDTWRAVFLAMTGETVHSTAAARSLWPEAF